MSLTGPGTFYGDYRVGDLLRHCRGKTVTAFDGAGLAQLVMNTSDGHFNDHGMRDSEVGRSVMFGAITLAIVVGLAMQDTGENAICELGMERVRFRVPVVHGDTLYAYSRVVAKQAGVVSFDHWGVNQHDQVVLELRRRARIAISGVGG
ncbi:MAG TPA: MaoC family dehydratase [Gaiellales bacterium]|nr:MaoC family dehydratase [Gaiellales bacterium]